MDFSAAAIAEQLTRIDSVRVSMSVISTLTNFAVVLHGWLKADRAVSVAGSVCQSGALPVSGLCVVAKRQEGKHVPHHPGHHSTVQCHHQPGHRVPAVSAYRAHIQSHFLPLSSNHSSTKGPHHREVDQSSTGQSESASPDSKFQQVCLYQIRLCETFINGPFY